MWTGAFLHVRKNALANTVKVNNFTKIDTSGAETGILLEMLMVWFNRASIAMVLSMYDKNASVSHEECFFFSNNCTIFIKCQEMKICLNVSLSNH